MNIPRPLAVLRSLGRFLLASALLVGCAKTPQVAPSRDDLYNTVTTLREEQMQLLYQYDAALREGDGGCRTLCKHHTRICVLATRICDMAQKQPDHYKARAACDKATQTCKETTERLPEECWCGD